jgi:excisionase family DNA binding protein
MTAQRLHDWWACRAGDDVEQNEPMYLTVDEAAALLRMDRKVLYREIAAGRVRGVKKIGRVIRLRRAALLTDDDDAS